MDTKYLRRFPGGQSWYFRIKVPERLRQFYGGKTVIERPLKTRDLSRANILKLTLLAQYKREFAGLEDIDPVTQRAAEFRAHFKNQNREVEADPTVTMLAEDEAKRMVARGVLLHEQEAHWLATATSSASTISELCEQWVTSQGYSPNTVLQHRRAVADLTAFLGGDRLPLRVADADAVGFFNALRDDAKAALNTKRRKMTSLHTLWEFLIQQRVVPRGRNLWHGFKFPRSQERIVRPEKRGYADAELELLFARRPRDDEGLADVMVLSLYSGARIESICSLTAGQVEIADDVCFVRILKDKTAAGIRTIAFVHPLPLALLRRRLDTAPSPEALLFPEFTPGGAGKSRYGYAVSKRFGTLRDSRGLPRVVDFHSFRRTVMTVLENGGVHDGHIAGFVGHEGGTMSRDVYSDGLWRKTVRDVAAKIVYRESVEITLAAFCAAASEGG